MMMKAANARSASSSTRGTGGRPAAPLMLPALDACQCGSTCVSQQYITCRLLMCGKVMLPASLQTLQPSLHQTKQFLFRARPSVDFHPKCKISLPPGRCACAARAG